MWMQILSALTLELVDECRSIAGIIHGYVDHLVCYYIENLIGPLFISHFFLTLNLLAPTTVGARINP